MSRVAVVTGGASGIGLGVAEDAAAACECLCSDDAGFITGQQIGVDGGWWL